jgi:hypothetical protein
MRGRPWWLPPSEWALDERDEWTPEEADAFISRARELFPGATEVDSDWIWVPRLGSGVEPTPEQCASPAERLRLWQEHGVHWVKTATWHCPTCRLGDKIVLFADGRAYCGRCEPERASLDIGEAA